MSGLEVGVAVMGIVAAFTTAADFFSRLRGKRKAKKAAKAKARQEQEEAAKEESVDKSLVLGRREVRREYDTDLARLGPEFQRGDETGVRQVQNMLIDLQNNVISVLTNLLTSSGSGLDDAVNKSVVGLLKSSDRTRKGTVRALKDQYQRMSIKKPLKAGPKAKNTYVLSVFCSRNLGADVYYRVLCRFYNTSRGCRYGDQCWYAHVDADSDSESGSDDTPSSEYPTTTTPSYRFTSYPGDHSSDDFCPFAIDLQKDSSIPIPEPNTREDGTTKGKLHHNGINLDLSVLLYLDIMFVNYLKICAHPATFIPPVPPNISLCTTMQRSHPQVHAMFRLDGDDTPRHNLGLIHGQIPRKGRYQRRKQTAHLGLCKLLADTTPRPLQERQKVIVALGTAMPVWLPVVGVDPPLGAELARVWPPDLR
jgi:hypothetical protein